MVREVSKLERIGIGMSLACAVHCAAMPVLIAALPLLGHQLADAHWVEVLLIGTAAVLGYFTLGLGVRRHRRPLPLILFTLGLMIVIGGHAEPLHDSGTTASFVGAALLAAAQVMNRRWSVPCCPDHALPGTPEVTAKSESRSI